MHASHYERAWQRFHKHSRQDSAACRAALTNCTFLEDSTAVVEGVRVHGSPWQPRYFDWGFNLARGPECRARWESIPADTHVVSALRAYCERAASRSAVSRAGRHNCLIG